MKLARNLNGDTLVVDSVGDKLHCHVCVEDHTFYGDAVLFKVEAPPAALTLSVLKTIKETARAEAVGVLDLENVEGVAHAN